MGSREEEEEGAVRASGRGTEPQGGGRALGSGSEPQRTGQSHRERVRATENRTEPQRMGQSHGAGQSQGKGVRATERAEVIGKRVRNRRTQAPLCLQLGPCCWPRSQFLGSKGASPDSVMQWTRGSEATAEQPRPSNLQTSFHCRSEGQCVSAWK